MSILPDTNVPWGKYILIKKALYDLKLATTRHYIMGINTYILSLGFGPLVTYSCMYVRVSYALGALVIIAIYADDVNIAARIMIKVNKMWWSTA